MVKTLSQEVADEIRAQMARKHLSQKDVAERLNKSPQWVHHRLSGKVGIEVEDLALFAAGVGTNLATLLLPLTGEGVRA